MLLQSYILYTYSTKTRENPSSNLFSFLRTPLSYFWWKNWQMAKIILYNKHMYNTLCKAYVKAIKYVYRLLHLCLVWNNMIRTNKFCIWKKKHFKVCSSPYFEPIFITEHSWFKDCQSMETSVSERLQQGLIRVCTPGASLFLVCAYQTLNFILKILIRVCEDVAKSVKEQDKKTI